ncbi:serine hydrolase domain-containing protein [Tenacibaculum soleae]|uniref:serine hydrolase domain-containing protein n=1 Tax=Tenacibaculum soleae TaxID=447689 RepID=UPI0022FFF9F5|nr:serine hydrolase domain-containing protein [Tenacibaculum soleae]
MKNLLISISLILFITNCKSQNNNNNNIAKDISTNITYNSIQQKIDSVLKENNIPSLSVGIINDGKLEFLKGFGAQKRGSYQNVTDTSIYQIASQSKMFTGIIVNSLINEGKLKLDEPIINYFPNTVIKEAKERLRAITLKNILQHTAGFPSDTFSVYRNRVEGGYWLDGYSEKELIDDINKVELEFEPGSKFSYSNSGYGVVGFICEQVSGKSYENLVKEYITDFYGLNNTVVTLSSEQKTLLVTPYRKDNRTIETKASIMGMATPASAIYSNISDLTKLMLLQIDAYYKYDRQKKDNVLILTKETANMNENLHYGFGLIKGGEGEQIKYGHGGDADGFACEYFFSPQKSHGVVILTSSGGRWVGKLADDILRML